MELYEESANLIIELCSKLNAKSYLAAGDGNVSTLIDDSRILITASGRNKAFLGAEDFAEVGLDGEVLRGHPSTELNMHLAIYRAFGSATGPGCSVVHAHPPAAIAWSLVNPDLPYMDIDQMPEVILGVGDIPVVPYQRPGSVELGAAVAEVAGSRPSGVVVLARHGVVSWGHSLIDAYNGVERVEHAALTLATAASFGEPKKMPKQELDWLRSRRREQSSNL